MNLTLVDRIYQIIDSNNLTQLKFAEIIGIQRSNISEWKTGKSSPFPKVLIKIVKEFPQIDANWLIRGELTAKITKSRRLCNRDFSKV